MTVQATPPPARQPEAGFMFIGELAHETGADPKTIRFYERAELLSPPRHGRFRTYLAADVKRLKNVLMLRRMGVPIAQIRALFTKVEAESDILADRQAAAMLRAHLSTLKSRQDEVSSQLRQTESALARLAAALLHEPARIDFCIAQHPVAVHDHHPVEQIADRAHMIGDDTHPVADLGLMR